MENIQRGVEGSSTPQADPANYDLTDYIEDSEAVRRAVGADQVHLLGHSWGGIVAMHYATVYPESVRSLILVGSGPPTWNGIMTAWASIGQRIQELQKQGILADPLPPGAEWMASFSDPSFPVEHPDENAARTESHQTVNQLMAHTDSLAHICPVCVHVSGDGDVLLVSPGARL